MIQKKNTWLTNYLFFKRKLIVSAFLEESVDRENLSQSYNPE